MSERDLEIRLLLNDKEALGRLNTALNQIEAESKRATQSASFSWTDLASKFYLAQQTLQPVIGLMTSAARAAMEQEDAIARLNVALQAQGTFSQQLSGYLQANAQSLQSSTRYADDAIMQVQQRLISIGNVAPSEMSKVTQAVLDFATATRTDLDTASNVIAKAAAGNTAALSRYGIVIDENVPKTERFGAALELISQKMGGAAQKDVSTFAGALALMNNQYGELLETLGNFIIKNESVVNGINLITESIKGLVDFISTNHGMVNEFFSLLSQGPVSFFADKGAEMMKGADPMAGLLGPMGMIASGTEASGAGAGGASVLESMFGGPEAQAAVLQTTQDTLDQVNMLKQADAMMNQTNTMTQQQIDFQNQMLSEQTKIEQMKMLWEAYRNEDTAAQLAKMNEEQSMYQFFLDTKKKADESYWVAAGKLRDTFSAGVSKMFQDAIEGNLKFGDALKQLGMSMVKVLIDFAVQKAINAALAKTLLAGEVAAGTGAAAALAAAWAIPAAFVSLATLGANAGPAAAGISSVAALAKGMSALSAIPGLATGGTVTGSGTVLVGERGPEFLNLPRGASVTPLDKASGGAMNISVTINNPVFNPGNIADELVEMMGPKLSAYLDNERERLV